MTNGKQKNCNEIGYVAFKSKVGKKKVESRNFESGKLKKGKWKVGKKKVWFMYVWTNVSDAGNASEADFSFSPRFAYRNGAWSFEMLRF
jgi:hypothetical protein